MKTRENIRKYLEKIRSLKREKHHPIIHEVHKKHNISHQTLLYIKEYGKRSNVSGTIVKESLKILLLASIISSFGGFALDRIELLFLSIYPLVLLLPSLNNMIGNYGTIISSRFSTMLYEGKVEKKWWKDSELKKLFCQIMIITLMGVILSTGIAFAITHFSQGLSFDMALRVFFIVLIDAAILANILFFIAVFAGLYLYKKQEDPNNFLIPLTTSIADFANMVILAVLILVLF
ncbi:MAG: magnesium transporter [Nanoarchaeota archaeon]|nr:magnesium transporter [Nanoarchaeota archaeon]